MPRKKAEKATAVVETEKAEAVKETEKKTAKKPAKTAAKKTAEKKTAEKKTAAKKTTTAAKKTAEKKTAEKKTAAKKAPAKKAAAKKAEPVIDKKSVQHYEDVINWKKGEAHGMDWLYIEINAGDLLTEVEAGVDNLEATCAAILNCMLEGDTFINDPGDNRVSSTLTVRYYCDNLSEDRRKYFE